MLYVLTGIYWASISAARAPKGQFCPDFLSFVVQFWAKIVFSPNIGVWGVQIIATERPAHTSLLQPIWSHPAQGNGQKQAKKGSFGPKVPLLVALEVLGGHGGPDLVTTVTGCSACVGLMVITHFGLILGLFCMVWYVIWFYCMVLRWILFHSIALQCIAWHFIVLYHMAWYCIVFDIIAVYCMSPHYILWYGMVLYFIWSYCTVSHCYVPLLQRAGELPRSASSHFYNSFFFFWN